MMIELNFLCNYEISVAHVGRSDIKYHLQWNRHKNSLSVAALASSLKLITFFKTASFDDKNMHLAAKEAKFAYHTP